MVRVDVLGSVNPNPNTNPNLNPIPNQKPLGQFHVTTDTTQKNKSSYSQYIVIVLYYTHITCHGFKGNIQIQLKNYEISPFEELCDFFGFFTLKITRSLAPIIMKY